MFAHLTNYSLNKTSPNFFVSKDPNADAGHKRLWSTVLQRLFNEGRNVDAIQQKIDQIIIKTMLTIQPDLAHNFKSCRPREREIRMCFEVLGFDIILDRDCEPYLLEVNHTPSFQCDNQIDEMIKYGLLKDTLNLVSVNIKERKGII